MSCGPEESGWQMVWNYQGSGAYGIAQALPASKMASAGADYMTDPATQIRVGPGLHQRHLRHAVRRLGARRSRQLVLEPAHRKGGPQCR